MTNNYSTANLSERKRGQYLGVEERGVIKYLATQMELLQVN